MYVRAQETSSEFDHGIAKIDHAGTRDRPDVDPLFRVREPDLKPAKPVEEDGDRSKVSMLGAFGTSLIELAGWRLRESYMIARALINSMQISQCTGWQFQVSI